jgi:hypothetical protein
MVVRAAELDHLERVLRLGPDGSFRLAVLGVRMTFQVAALTALSASQSRNPTVTRC